MKKASDVFKSIRFAKGDTRDKPHKSTDDEEHYAVGEKEFNQQLKHVKKMAMMEQHREQGRFKPTIPKMVKSSGVGPRPSVDSVKVKLGEDANEDPREYDYEGDMVKSDLRSIIANAQRIIDMVSDEHNFPEWCQNKVTLAEDYISTVANYLTAEMSEEVEQIDEKNVPTSPEKWAQAKAQAKAKFDVYPSAYANGWAAKKYKAMGGGWKSVSEAKEDLPFEPDPKPRKKSVIPGKHGEGYSTARHLARMAMQRQSEKIKKPIKEEEMSKKAQIVKGVMKKKKDEKSDKFQSEPIISQSVTKNY